MKTALALIAATLLLAAAPAASAETISATSGALRAELDYTAGAFANELGNLRVTRGATLVYDAKVDAADCGGTCYLGSDPADPAALRWFDLDLDGEPEVIVKIYTGGAHCCTVARVLQFQASTSTYAAFDQNFADWGFALSDQGNDMSMEFFAADSRFAYRFTAYVFSGLPVLLYRFERGVFVEVGKSYPAALRSDAARWRKAIRTGIKRGKLRRDSDLRGFYAAWAADQYRLGKGRSAVKALKRSARRGWLKGNGIGKENLAYVRDLLGFLKRIGYR